MNKQEIALIIKKDWSERILIDFDKTIHKFSEWGDGLISGDMIEGTKEAIDQLYEMGFNVYIFTSRLSHPELVDFYSDQLEAIKKWLDKQSIRYSGVTGIKLPAFAYIDDKAINFTSWGHVLNVVSTWKAYNEMFGK